MSNSFYTCEKMSLEYLFVPKVRRCSKHVGVEGSRWQNRRMWNSPILTSTSRIYPQMELFSVLTEPFELWCWRRLLRVPWTARRSTQSILKEISPACSDAGRDWGQEEKGMTEDEMARWHHRLDGRESE